MASFNKVILMGNLTRDIELRHTPSNQAVANFGLAMNRNYRTASGEDREEVTFVDCEAWGRTAEIMAKYLQKGRPVFVEGRLRLDTWQDKDGNRQSRLRVVVDTFQFIDSRGGQGSGQSGHTSSESDHGSDSNSESASDSGGSREYGRDRGGRAAVSSGVAHEPVNDDDIPF